MTRKLRRYLTLSSIVTLAILLAPFAVRLDLGAGLGIDVLAASAAAQDAPCYTSVRIMPLGDSITAGEDKAIPIPNGEADKEKKWIGYRKPLWDSLVADYPAIDFNFVGSLQHGTDYISAGFDPDNEGHEGKTAAYVASMVDSWLTAYPADFVLLHIGTNSLTTDPSNVKAILDNINLYETNNDRVVIVILARIINRVTYSADTTTFNNNLASMAKSQPDYGTELFLVDMENGAGLIYQNQPAGDMSDNLHPYATGYAKMAGVWKAALDELLQECNNVPPEVTSPGPQTSKEGDPVSLQIQASDPNGDSLIYSAAGLPGGLSINPSTGLISGMIAAGTPLYSPYPVTITVQEDKSTPLETTVPFQWTVQPNQKPVVTNPGPRSSAEGDTVSLKIQASDPDEDSLTYTATGLPGDLSIGLTTGLISGTINYEASSKSPYTVVVTVTDDRTPQRSESISFQWTVRNTNLPPSVTSPGDQNSKEGDTISLKIQAADPEGGPLTFKASGLPPGLSINAQTGVLSGRIGFDAHQGSPYQVQVTVTDNLQQNVVVSFTWTVQDRPAIFLPIITK